MEDQLGLTLFRRERGRLQATVEARRLYDEVEQVFRRHPRSRRLIGGYRAIEYKPLKLRW